jgi:hypothetical protein
MANFMKRLRQEITLGELSKVVKGQMSFAPVLVVG